MEPLPAVSAAMDGPRWWPDWCEECDESGCVRWKLALDEDRKAETHLTIGVRGALCGLEQAYKGVADWNPARLRAEGAICSGTTCFHFTAVNNAEGDKKPRRCAHCGEQLGSANKWWMRVRKHLSCDGIWQCDGPYKGTSFLYCSEPGQCPHRGFPFHSLPKSPCTSIWQRS